MMARPRIVADIRDVLEQAGLSGTADAVIATLTGASTAVKGAPCANATPADGTLVECDFEPGGTLLWMAYRPKGQKGPGLLRGVRWAGEKPFRAYLFRVTQDDGSTSSSRRPARTCRWPAWDIATTRADRWTGPARPTNALHVGGRQRSLARRRCVTIEGPAGG
jgi:hypothetical protein